MAGDMTLQVIVRLRDEMNSGLNSALGKIRAWGARVTGILGGIGRGVLDLSTKFGALGIGAGAGLTAGLQSLVDYDAKLRDVAITYGKTGKAVEDFVKKSGSDLDLLAKKTGQTSKSLAGALGLLAAANVDEGAAKQMLPAIGRGATASGAAIEDIAKTAIAAQQNAGISPSQLDQVIAHAVVGGKLGSFELKDMSQHYPTILAALANLGIKGMEGIDTATAALQISKRTAGTSGEAATNFLDFLSGINSAHTIKRFKDKGVDLTGVMADAQARGINPLEAVVQKIGKVIDQPKVVDEAIKRSAKLGLDPTKTQQEIQRSVGAAIEAKGLGELFVNQQSKMFLMAMLAGKGDYLDFKKQIAGAGGDVVDQDFASRMNGYEAQQRMAAERIEQLSRRLGEALTWLFDVASKLAEKGAELIAALDQISPAIVNVATNLIALASVIASAVLGARILGLVGSAAPVAAGVGAAAGLSAGEAAAGGAAAGGGAAAAGRLGLLSRLGIAGAVAGGLSYLDPKGNLWGLTSGVDAWAKKHLGFDPSNIQLPELPALPDLMGPKTREWMKTNDEGLKTNKAAGGSARPAGRFGQVVMPVAPPQKVDVGGSITIKVDGPGTVQDVRTLNPSVPIGTDRGSNGGRY